LLNKLTDKKITVVLGVSGVEVNAGDFFGQIIYPDLNDIFSNKTNEKSQVMIVDFLNQKMLFTGDITDKIFKNIVENNGIYSVDILKSPHHGGKKTINADILSKLNVKEAIISVGDNNYGHPSFETLNIYNDFNVKVRRTDLEGNIIIE
jgi:competence protein ComEC